MTAISKIYPDQVSGASPLTCPRNDSGAYSSELRSDGAADVLASMAPTDADAHLVHDVIEASRDAEATPGALRRGLLVRKFNEAFDFQLAPDSTDEDLQAMSEYARMRGRRDIAGRIDYELNKPADEEISSILCLNK